MEFFSTQQILESTREVYRHEYRVESIVRGEAEAGTDEIHGFEEEDAAGLLYCIQESLPSAGFPRTIEAAHKLAAQANIQGCTYNELLLRVQDVREALESELFTQLLISIPTFKAVYCNRQDGFGEDAAKAFPSTIIDMRDAGNCYAAGFDTACVFHSMRVLEKGLVALAKGLQVPLSNENWGKMLDGLEKVIGEIAKLPTKDNPTKPTDLQFYSEAVKEFRYFKDAWRNHVMHACTRYTAQEARKIMEHVQDFMQHLSLRLSE
jgi:hypothetical protein